MKLKKFTIFKSKLVYLIAFSIFVNSQFIYAETGKADLKDYDFDEGAAAYRQGDYATAVKKFMGTAEKGDYRAMYALGSMYFDGIGVEQDYMKAYRWFKEAVNYNYIPAEYKLGLMHDEGTGIPKDYKKAARLYNKAAKRGFGPAQYGLGLLYANGHGTTQNNVKAYAWLATAEVYFSKVINEDKEGNAETKQGTTDELEKEVKRLDKRLDEEFAAQKQNSLYRHIASIGE